ncbi:MAG: hypothetical protein R2831_00705 [Chitinophagaceae bacterium]
MSIQLFFLNDIAIKSSVSLFGIPIFTPIIYPLIFINLPIRTPIWVELIIAFVIGFIVDMFSNTSGIHASASLLLAFSRPRIISLFFQYNPKEKQNIVPNLYQMGFMSYILYAGILLLIHHFWYYLIQIWSFRNTPIILLKTISSLLLSLLLVVIFQLLFSKKESIRK